MRLRKTAPKVHCLTNPVTMQDVANVLLAAGGSAIMAQDKREVEEITVFCQATLLNTGVPDRKKWKACILAGQKANELNHPVVLDPVGAGASSFRREGLHRLLKKVRVSLIRCNQEEAYALLNLNEEHAVSGGVESAVSVAGNEQELLAHRLAQTYGCTVLVSGETDIVSDGKRAAYPTGGDRRITRITGGGCMLSALCALFCGAGIPAFDAAYAACSVWRRSADLAGRRADEEGRGIGSFHGYLFDALEQLCRDGEERI